MSGSRREDSLDEDHGRAVSRPLRTVVVDVIDDGPGDAA